MRGPVRTELNDESPTERSARSSLHVDPLPRDVTFQERPRIKITDPGEDLHVEPSPEKLPESQTLNDNIQRKKQEMRLKQVEQNEIPQFRPPALDEFNEEHDSEYPDRARANRLYLVCYVICTHWLFTFCITLLILGNTIILAMDRHPIDEAEFKGLGKLRWSL